MDDISTLRHCIPCDHVMYFTSPFFMENVASNSGRYAEDGPIQIKFEGFRWLCCVKIGYLKIHFLIIIFPIPSGKLT